MTQRIDVALSVRGLRKSYGSRRALDGLDLTVPTGVVYGFLGPNGAGKTTTMRLLTGLLHPDGGRIELFGKPVGHGDRRRLFQVGALVESPSFYPYLSGRANLRELAATGGGVPAGRIEEVLELVGLRDRATDKVQGYSMGMKQRLGIAAALLSDPRLLLLDEPTNGLDPAGIVAMRDMLCQLAGAGKTVFVSSHLLPEVQAMADVVGIIASGKLVREGPLREMLSLEGIVKVRVPPAAADQAMAALAPLARTERLDGADLADGWLGVHIEPHRAADVNRMLAEHGIYASGLETGTDLEVLFLELTAGSDASAEGSFQTLPGNGASSAGSAGGAG